MPKGKGTYGNKRGRPPKKKTKSKKKREPRSWFEREQREWLEYWNKK